ncbi:glycosyltransferase involved in cell wall biosynthesis [Variovorax boronicumulans]|uniref:glycosyltransferase n=1 Tax=Variovorax boronicumulans TaxID=436515 RepID=UPI0027805612|nr:glycosyltransferase [Variovorax boronicumulans]MDP9911810.1 glycosyltransferase involved in cell wall biosynthesis [Variovorax boronicumulans]
MMGAHVLLVPSWYPASHDDINGSFFRAQAVALAKEGIKVGVIAPILESLRSPIRALRGSFSITYENDLGVDTYRKRVINAFPGMPALTEKLWQRMGLKLYAQYVKEHGRPQVLHVHSMLYAGSIARIIKKKYGIPYVITEHSTAFARRLVNKKQISLLTGIAHDAAARFAVSSAFCNLLSKQLGENGGEWKALPNMIEDAFFSEASFQPKSLGEFVFLTVCFLRANKRVDLLLHAFARACAELPFAKIRIGGDGPERVLLEKIAAEIGIADKVEFIGELSRCRVIEEMKKANVFVLSSEFETFGVVVAEALALGKPVVATICGGPEDIVQEKDGILVPKNDVSAMSKALIHMGNNAENYDALDIQNRCRARYSEKSVTGELIGRYRDVISGTNVLA